MKLKDNPNFLVESNKYLIIHPLTTPSAKTIFSNSPKIQTFTIEDVQTNDSLQINMQWLKETNSRGYIDSFNKKKKSLNILDIFFNTENDRKPFTNTYEMEKGDVAEIKDFVLHQIDIHNFIDNTFYEVVGQVYFFRTIEKESERSTFETTTTRFPIEFWIFKNEHEVGNIRVDQPSVSSQSLRIYISLNDRLLNLEFEEHFNKRKVSIEYENQLVAFFDLKPAAFISTKKKGDAFIKQDVSEDFVADIFTSYILSDIMEGVLRNK